MSKRKTIERLRPVAGASGQSIILDHHVDGPPRIQREAISARVVTTEKSLVSHGMALRDADGLSQMPSDREHLLVEAGLIPPPETTTIRPPMVERIEWPDPDDMSARMRRAEKPGDRVTAKSIRGWKRVWTIDTLHRTLPNEITEEHVRAATRLINDRQQREGANTGGHTNGGGDMGPEDVRVAAGIRYDEATEAVGDQGSYLLYHIAVLNWSLTQMATHLGIDRNRTLGRLQGALERLREHYDRGKKRKAPMTTLAPVLVIPIEDTGLPPDRSGRWDRLAV